MNHAISPSRSARSSTSTSTSRRRPTPHLSDFTELTARVKDRGLLHRNYRHYWTKLILLPAFGLGLLALFVLLGDTWWQMALAATLALLMTQIAFLGHDAAHRQIFKSPRWNEWTAMVLANLFVGIGVSSWTGKHNKHHAAPNKLGSDPDISSEVLVLNPEDTPERGSRTINRWRRALARLQVWYFFPLLTLEGLNLHYKGFKRLLSAAPVKHRGVELTFLIFRLASFIAIVFIVLPPGKAALFLAVSWGLFGFYLGMAFAPNHIGMPMAPRNVTIDFLRRQVLMSRNISGGRVTSFLMGGLNYQIEHHLFPSMPRPNLRHAAPLVREHCQGLGISYYETPLWRAYGEVASYIRQVGRGGVDVWQCPLSQQLGR